jgi:hypothetical protein
MIMSVQRILLVATAFVLMLAVLGCGSKRAKSTTSPASIGDFPTGTFANSDQAWTWEFNADGSYLARGLQSREKGTFTVNGSQISLKGDYCGDITGNYNWTFDGTALEFNLNEDICSDRAGVVVTGKWDMRP